MYCACSAGPQFAAAITDLASVYSVGYTVCYVKLLRYFSWRRQIGSWCRKVKKYYVNLRVSASSCFFYAKSFTYFWAQKFSFFGSSFKMLCYDVKMCQQKQAAFLD